MSRYTLVQGDVLEVLRELPSNSADGLFCDPPYGISFMNKHWDYDIPSVDVWREALRVLKPGAPLLSFGGTRTSHRIVCSIEDAGFEICDSIAWIYAKGMPKPATTTDKYIDQKLKSVRPIVGTQKLSGNAGVSTQDKGGTFGVQVGTAPAKVINITAPGSPEALLWEGYGHALKPAHEPVCVACKPFDGSIANNVLTNHVGGLNLPDTRVLGRWPSNLLFSHHPECSQHGTKRVKAHPSWTENHDPSTFTGEVTSEVRYADKDGTEEIPVFVCVDECPVLALQQQKEEGHRFFYCTKVGKKERDAGCEHLPRRSAADMTGRKEEHAGKDRPQAGAGRGSGARNYHPTLKPLELTKYLGGLIMPPTDDAVLLVPFAGSGSEMIGALLAGWPCVLGIEQDAGYIEIAHARIAHWMPTGSEVAA